MLHGEWVRDDIHCEWTYTPFWKLFIDTLCVLQEFVCIDLIHWLLLSTFDLNYYWLHLLVGIKAKSMIDWASTGDYKHDSALKSHKFRWNNSNNSSYFDCWTSTLCKLFQLIYEWIFSFPRWTSALKIFQFILQSQVACNLVIFLLDFQLHFCALTWVDPPVPVWMGLKRKYCDIFRINRELNFSIHCTRKKIARSRRLNGDDDDLCAPCAGWEWKFINYFTNYDNEGNDELMSRKFMKIYSEKLSTRSWKKILYFLVFLPSVPPGSSLMAFNKLTMCAHGNTVLRSESWNGDKRHMRQGGNFIFVFFCFSERKVFNLFFFLS